MLRFEAKRELERIEPVVEVIVVASPAAMLASTPSALALSPDGDASHGAPRSWDVVPKNASPQRARVQVDTTLICILRNPHMLDKACFLAI